MPKLLKGLGLIVVAIALSAGFGNNSVAKTKLRMSSTPPGTGPYLFLSTFADVVNKFAGDIEIQINATGVATKHYVQATRGRECPAYC